MNNAKSCIKGYSCGYSCIAMQYECATDSLKNEQLRKAILYFKLISEKTNCLGDNASVSRE